MRRNNLFVYLSINNSTRYSLNLPLDFFNYSTICLRWKLFRISAFKKDHKMHSLCFTIPITLQLIVCWIDYQKSTWTSTAQITPHVLYSSLSHKCYVLDSTRKRRKKIVEREKENKIFHGNQAVNGVDFFQFNLSWDIVWIFSKSIAKMQTE